MWADTAHFLLILPIFKDEKILYFMCVGILSVYIYAPYAVPGILGGQKRTSESLEKKLQMTMSRHVGSGN